MFTKIKVFFYKVFKSKNMMIMVCPFCKGVHFRRISRKYNFDEEYKEGADDKYVDIFICERCEASVNVCELWKKQTKD